MYKEIKMNRFKKKLRQDAGSIDFIQLVVGLLIVSVASIGTIDALLSGYEHLDYQMRFRKAISIARSYVEYWQGRIHTDAPSTTEMVGNLMNPKVFLLDERNPNTDFDDIYCEVRYSRIQAQDFLAEGEANNYGEVDDDSGGKFFLISVNVSWYEPSDDRNISPREIEFYAAMVQASM
jgi:hypothetical protein